jgi:exosortase/archaeosortase family protein
MENEGLEWSPRDLILYVALFIFFMQGFKFAPSGWMELLTARISSLLIQSLGMLSSYGLGKGGAYLTLDGTRMVEVVIIRECTGIHVWGILAGLVLPLKYGSWIRKALSLALGAILVVVLNISRIILTVYLTAYDVPPLSWFSSNPTVETYHYPISFLYGVIGIMVIILIISRFLLPELGRLLVTLPDILLAGFSSLESKFLGNQPSE